MGGLSDIWLICEWFTANDMVTMRTDDRMVTMRTDAAFESNFVSILDKYTPRKRKNFTRESKTKF